MEGGETIAFLILLFLFAAIISVDYLKVKGQQYLYRLDHQPYRATEEYLSVWLTTFVYMFLDENHHDDPYVDARRDVDQRFDKRAHRSATDNEQVFPKSDSDWLSRSMRERMMKRIAEGGLFGPCRITYYAARELDEKSFYEGTGYAPEPGEKGRYICAMDKRYNDLVDLYASWFETHPASDYKQSNPELYNKYLYRLGADYGTMDFAIKKYEERKAKAGYYLKKELFQFPQYTLMRTHSVVRYDYEEYLATGASASLFDLKRLVPESVRAHYGEMQEMILDFQKKYGIESCHVPKSTSKY